MSETDIASLCHALSIREKESPAKILDVNREAFRDVMQRVWRVSGGVEIKAIEDNVFEFQFKNLEAKQKVLSGGPWRFDRALLVLEEPSATGDIANMEFNRTEFWVQIHNLPILCMSEEIGLFLGNMIGEVRNVDLDARKNGSSRFIRVRVGIKVDEPLKRSLRVDLLGDRKITTMLLRYERVPDFYYKCNRLGHNIGECSNTGDNREATTEANIRLCTWMRTVSPPKKYLYGSGKGRKE
ncbi:hypothetical protein EZV62_018449 [Acer yangbiense]|uniref:DUF4283 domain-containing protein n=1 Tax=Acer yangbiense TaxID=1000413 RepID=A0A5C7HLJ4_9ROSI|nr:hypothetical protein EZV62_018449 [Acer yangbiense]